MGDHFLFLLDIFISLLMATRIAGILQFNECLANNLISFNSIHLKSLKNTKRKEKSLSAICMTTIILMEYFQNVLELIWNEDARQR